MKIEAQRYRKRTQIELIDYSRGHASEERTGRCTKMNHHFRLRNKERSLRGA